MRVARHAGRADRLRRPVAGLALLLLSIAPFLPALRGGRIWDDHQILSGEAIGGGSDLLSCFTNPFGAQYYRPLVSLSFFLERRLWGDWLPGYHLTNIALHVLGTAAMFGLLGTVFQDRRIAWAGAAVFAVHPVNVGTVAWIGGRTDSLSEAWLACSLWALVAAARSDGRRRVLLATVSTVAFAGAAFSKEQALAALPLPALSAWLFRRADGGRVWRSAWGLSAPFALVGAAYTVMLLHIAPLPLRPFDPLYQLRLTGETLTYYTLILLLPTPAAMHTMTVAAVEQAGWPASMAGWAALAGVLSLSWSWLRTRPAAAWCLATAVLLLLPVSNIISPPSLGLVAPWRAALPLLGVAGVIGWAWVSALPATAGGVRAGAVACAAYGFWLLGLTLWGSGLWQGQRAIDSAFARCDPDCLFTRKKLAGDLLAEGRGAEAVREVEAAFDRLFGSRVWADPAAASAAAGNARVKSLVLANHGAGVDVRERLADLYWTLGFTRAQAGDSAGAIASYQIGRILYPQHAGIDVALARAAIAAGDLAKAVTYLRAAAGDDAATGAAAEAHGLLGWVHGRQGDWHGAAVEYEIWTRLQPGDPDAWLHLCEAQLRLGQQEAAMRTIDAGRARAGLSAEAVAALLRRVGSGPGE